MNIYVGNLSFDATQDDLRELFEGFGQVESVSIITDKFSGKSRGFGFVEMLENAAGQRAISGLDGKPFMERDLTVNEARPRTERREGGGGGREGGRSRN